MPVGERPGYVFMASHPECLPPRGPCAYTGWVMRKKWILPEHDPEIVDSLFRTLRISPVTARMLANRGLQDAQSARRFLEPSLHQLIDPANLELISSAAAFLLEAADSNRHITVYGDYDADGICAAALMTRALRALGGEVDYYVPRRFDEGYGLSKDAVKELDQRGTDVIVTVDCGISASGAVKLARQRGMEVILTDHHEPGSELPKTRYILNPHLPDCQFGYERLAGVGVAFKLAWAAGQQRNGGRKVDESFKELMVDLLPLVAIGTIADMVELNDENRVMTQFGLRVMPSTTIPGLKALLKVAGAENKSNLRSYHVGFQLAPRLNAAGRMADASAAIELFTTDDPDRARELVDGLEKENRRRQNIQRATIDEAVEHVEQTLDLDSANSIVVYNPEWHPGVVGLVAARLADDYWRPAFVFSGKNGLARGSARGIPGLNLFEAISQCEELLETFGGHEGAAGLSLSMDRFEDFQRRIDRVVQEELGEEPPGPRLKLEGEVELEELSKPVVRELRLLSPYGMANPEPLFCTHGVRLAGNPQIVGSRQNHLSFMVRQGKRTLKVIAFGKSDWLPQLKSHADEPFSIAFQPQINTWRNRSKVELRAEDIQFQGEQLIETGEGSLLTASSS